MAAHPFWTILSFAVIAWYIVVTAIVAFKGSTDIKNMLGEMEGEKTARDKKQRDGQT